MKKQSNKPLNKLISSIFIEWGFTTEGLKDNRRGEWWLFAQLIILLAHFVPSSPILSNWPLIVKGVSIIIFSYGFYRSYLSLITLGDNLSPLPEPKESAVLITRGVYKSCRHPLYQSLLYLSFAFTCLRGSLIHLTLLILLSIILINKAKVEELKLKSKYYNYTNYMSITPAIFNGIRFFDWRN